MIFTRRLTLFSLAGFLLAVLTATALMSRVEWERDRVVEIGMDGRELRALFPNNEDFTGVLRRLGEAGISSLAIPWDGEESLATLWARWAHYLPPGMSITLRPEIPPFSPVVWSDVFPLGMPLKNLLPSGHFLPGHPAPDEFLGWADASGAHFPWMEGNHFPGTDPGTNVPGTNVPGTNVPLARRFLDKVLRGHSISEEEMTRTTPTKALSRFRRAVRERGARFLYVHFFPGLSAKANVDYGVSLAENLRRDGFVLESAVPRFGQWRKTGWNLSPAVRQVLAFWVSVLGPLLAFRWGLSGGGVIKGILKTTMGTLAVALVTAAFLSAPEFALGFHSFRGVKIALGVPLAAAVFLLYKPHELRRFLSRPLTTGLAVTFLAAVGILGIYILRSGHESVFTAGIFELRLRSALEVLFGVRPRFKEFALGHPLLWLGFWWTARRRQIGPICDGRPFLLAGFIGQLSMVNTFCHPHVPLWVSLLRTWHGFWLGSLLGLCLIGIASYATRRPL